MISLPLLLPLSWHKKLGSGTKLFVPLSPVPAGCPLSGSRTLALVQNSLSNLPLALSFHAASWKAHELWPLSQTSCVLCKVGGVYRRLCHRAILRHATLKYSIFRFWHLPIKFDPLNPKMAFFLRFGTPKLPKSTFEVCILNISLPDQSKNFRETS